MQAIEITSVHNPLVKQIIRLKERKERTKTDLFLIEGYRELLRAIDSGIKINVICFCREFFLGTNEDALLSRIEGKRYECTSQVFQKISYRDRPDGLLAIGVQEHYTLHDLEKQLEGVKNPFLIAAEAIEKPGNLGTILRSSDGVGVDCLIVCDQCTDVYNPNTVRASVGTLFTVPIVEGSSEETILWLKKNKIQIVAATPSGEKEFTQVDLRGPLCIAVGTEQLGLSSLWMDAADIKVRIKMKGAADSLNVAQATTLLLYEVLRQRENV